MAYTGAMTHNAITVVIMLLTFLCRFALAFTLYFTVMHVMAYWCYDMATFRSFWFATVNSNNMWYCFLKAWVNVLVGKVTRKQSGFKVMFQHCSYHFCKVDPERQFLITVERCA